MSPETMVAAIECLCPFATSLDYVLDDEYQLAFLYHVALCDVAWEIEENERHRAFVSAANAALATR